MSDEEGFEEQFVQQKPTLIIFHGPPCSGKTKYYKDHYERTFVRFSLEEWFEKNAEATLHKGIGVIAKKLKDGDSVVLDDCNPTEKARNALIASLRKQAGDFRLEGVEFRPKGGLLQSQVAAQFLSAQLSEDDERQRLNLVVDLDLSDDDDDDDDSVMDLDQDSDASEGDKDKHSSRRGLAQILASNDDHTKSERRRQDMLKDWDSMANGLSYGEGFQLIQFIDQEVSLEVKELVTPALIIDAQTIITFNRRKGEDYGFEASLLPNVFEGIRDWKMATPGGRVIVIVDDEAVLPVLVREESDSPETQLFMIRSCHQQILSCLSSLECLIPLYYYHIQFGAFDINSFHRITNPGPIAWLLRRHHLLPHRSLWIAPCPKNVIQVVPFGIPYMSATEFFATGGWDFQSKLRQFLIPNPSLPPWLSFLSNPPETQAICGEEGAHSIDPNDKESHFLPLEAERRSLLQAHPEQANQWFSVLEEISFGRTHGCWFPPSNPNKKRRATAAPEILETSPSSKRSTPAPQASQAIEIHDSSSIPVLDLDTPTIEGQDGAIVIDSQDP
jgi:hypothetical protein